MNQRVLLIIALCISQFGCAPSSAEPELLAPVSQNEPKPHRFVAEIRRVLPPGWDIGQNGDVIVVARSESVPTYGNIAMPPHEILWREMKNDPNLLKYEIRIAIAPLVSKAEYEKLRDRNAETQRELRFMSYAMDEFKSKTTYNPRNAREQELHAEYLDALRKLPYSRLPDLYDETHSYYVTTTLHSRVSFVYPRQERECRAVLEYILSLADGYRDFTKTTAEDEYFERPFDRLGEEIFRSRRESDSHETHREDNLRELRGTLQPATAPERDQ